MNPLCLPIPPHRLKSSGRSIARPEQTAIKCCEGCVITLSSVAIRTASVIKASATEYLKWRKGMAMNLIKKTSEYKIFKRGDERFAVQDATGKPVNGEEKVNILLAEELIKVTLPGAEPEPVEEAPAEEEAAVEASGEDEAPADEEVADA